MAQVYYKLGFGQGFTSAGQTAIFDQPYQGTISYDQGTGKLSTFNVKNVSFGAGTHAVISVGDMFGKHVGGELSALIGIAPKKFKGTESFPYDANVYENAGHTMYAHSGLIINPSIVLQTANDFNLYTRIGLLLPLAINVNDDFSQRYSQMVSADQVYTGRFEYKTMFGLGYSAALGFSLNLVSHVNLWAEGYMNSLSLDVKEAKLTKLEYNSRDILNQQSASAKDIKYSKKSDASASSRFTFSIPFSSVGFRVGLSVSM